MNHPENIHTGFKSADPRRFHQASGESLDGRPWDFDAIEVLNSSAHQSDMMKPFRDWFALLNRGKRIVAVGSSDCHNVNKYIVGQSRTYIASSAARPDQIDVDEACRNLLAGRALVSMGLLTEAWVDGKYGPGDTAPITGDHISMRVRVRGPTWIAADRIEIYGNGQLLISRPIAGDPKRVVKLDETLSIPKPKHDMWLVAIASGPGIREPYWPISRPYQPIRADWEPRMIGSTNPIFIDADGDGRYSSPFDYAGRIVQSSGGSIEKTCAACEAFDEAVAVQCASLLRARGLDLKSANGVIDQAAPQVRQGMLAYINLLPIPQ